MRRALLTALQLAITAAILWFVFRDHAKRAEMFSTLHRANLLWLLLGLATYGIVELGAGLRWRLLLQVQGIQLVWSRVLSLVFIGLFFNFFIPGATGGDAVKIFYLLKETPGRRAPALLSVLVDRLLGLFALVLLASVLIALKWSWLTSTAETARWVWIVLAVLAGSLGFLVLSAILSSRHLVHRLPARFPGRDKLAEIALAYNLYGRKWQASLGALLISVPTHLGYYFTFYCAARSFGGVEVKLPNLPEFFAVMPIVGTITSLPISLGGIGWREVLFETFLRDLCGVSGGLAVAVSSTGYLLTLAWGLFGGALYLLYRPSVHPKLREMRAEVAAFEHEVAAEEMALESSSRAQPRDPVPPEKRAAQPPSPR